MNNLLFDRIREFITDQGFGYTLPFPFLFRKKLITREMALERDLKITGDDADEFLVAFGKEFAVDVSNFPFSDYFDSEGDKLISSTIKAIKGVGEVNRKVLTVGHLERAAILGRLDEQALES
jgi:hypothetical protein